MSLFTFKIDRVVLKLDDHSVELLNQKLNKIMSTQAELAEQLTALKDQTDKANAELLQKISDLEAAIVAAGNTTPEVDAALAALKDSVQKVDDIVPDQPPVTEG